MPSLPPLHHVGIVVTDMSAASADFERRWGAPTVDLYEATWTDAVLDGQTVTFSANYGFIRTGASQIELIQPVAGPSPYADFLHAHGEGVHHLAYMVEAIDPFLSELLGADDGVRLHLDARIPPAGRFVYLDGAAHGPVVELIEYPDVPAEVGDVEVTDQLPDGGPASSELSHGPGADPGRPGDQSTVRPR